jgi:apolipoprotein L
VVITFNIFIADFRMFFEINKVKTKLTISKLELDSWLRCNMALEILCGQIIDELEGRRRNVNISNIVGSSVGLVGSALVVAGVATAPFTFGVSLGLAVAGGVVGGLGGLTVVGTNVTEFVMNKDKLSMLERYQMNLSERSRCLDKSLSDLEKEMEIYATQDRVDNSATALQSGTGTLCMLSFLPSVIVRVIARSITVIDVIAPPLSILLDLGVLAFNIYNLVKGSKTNVTEKLRAVRSVLRTTRIQMFIWGYGNQEKYLQSLEEIIPKRS